MNRFAGSTNVCLECWLWKVNQWIQGSKTGSSMPASDIPLILSMGTQVVALIEVRGLEGKMVHPPKALGVIVQSPSDHWHSYRVRFPDGIEASFTRR